MLKGIAKAALSAGLLLSALALPADDFEDFKALFENVIGNFSEAVSSGKDSRVSKEYEASLRKLEDLATKVQTAVARLKIEDVNFPKYVTRIKEIYIQRSSFKKTPGKSLERSSGLWFPTGMIREDINTLEKMEFSAENGGSYKKELAKKPALDEFSTLLAYYQRHIVDIADASSISEWRALFEKKMARMSYLGREMQAKLVKECPDFAKDNNIPKEVAFLMEYYNDLSSYYGKSGSEGMGLKSDKSNDKSSGKTYYDEKTGKSKSSTEADRTMKDVNFTLKRLQEMLGKLKGMNFTFESKFEPPKEQAGEEAKDAGSDEKDLEGMTVKELEDLLKQERDRIYKSNIALTGISPMVQKYYLSTLTKKQKERYSDMVRKYVDRDYKDDMARSSALLELHGYLRSSGDSNASKDELVRILKKVRTEKEKMDEDVKKEKFDHSWR